MSKKRFTEAEILSIFKEQESGISIRTICEKYGISEATFYNWKNRYPTFDSYENRRIKELEEENALLKKMFADLSLDIQFLRDTFLKKGLTPPQRSG